MSGQVMETGWRANALWLNEGALRQGDLTMVEEFNNGGRRGFLWLDFAGVPSEVEQRWLVDEFRFDRSVVEAAHADRYPPKLELLGDSAFMMLRGFNDSAKTIDYKVVHIAAFFTRGIMVTRHRERSPSVEIIWRQALEQADVLSDGPTLALKLAQTVAGRHLPIVLAVEERLEEIEEEIFTRPRDDLLNELMLYRRQLKKLRRNANYSANAFQQLLQQPSRLFEEFAREGRREIREVHDRFERLSTLSALYGEIASDLMNGYMSFSSHRLNHVMKILTVITAIFVPLTFLTSIYGMNFDNMPELHTHNGYFIAIGVMTSVAGVLVLAFRRLGWV